MKIEYRKGNLLATDVKHILHGCNCQGVMGSGVAKVVRAKYPMAYNDYMNVYNNSGLQLGDMIMSVQDNGKIIINALTQETFGKTGVHVSYWAVANVFKTLNRYLYGQHVALPMIGAGLGGGDWNTIAAIIENEAKVYQPIVYQL